jgi:hypothetical protein
MFISGKSAQVMVSDKRVRSVTFRDITLPIAAVEEIASRGLHLADP